MTAPRLTLTAAVTAVVAGFAALALLLMPAPGSNAPVAHAATVAPEVHVGGTAVSSTIDGEQLAPADAAFLADLFEGATDLDEQQTAVLVETAHRVCDLLAHPENVPPGAERPTRQAMLDTFTLPTPSATTGWSLDEATKFLDTAEAAYCPQVLAETYPDTSAPTTAASPAAPRTTAPSTAAAPSTTPAPVVEPAPTATAAPSTTDEPVHEQLPEEQIGGARCGDTTEVIVALDTDGTPICG
jgi:hypothetical protein